MEPLPPQTIDRRPVPQWRQRQPGFRALRSLVVLLAILPGGCVTTEQFTFHASDQPANQVCRVVSTWIPEVVFTPDPTHRGTPIPGVRGRVYLFDQDIPVSGDGCIVVDLFDDRGGAAAKAQVPLEEWRFDKDNLKRLQRRDAFGLGYSLFLPWATYKPEITQVQLRVRYEPSRGSTLYGDPASVAFSRSTALPAADVASRPGKPRG